jgi:hypothetical protein
MPSRDAHLSQASHNEALLEAIDRTAYSDWAMTIAFYAALQYVDAWLAVQGTDDPGSHDVRDQEIHADPQLVPISRLYFRLKNRSRNARYHAARFTPTEVARAIADDLGGIRRHITGLLRA